MYAFEVILLPHKSRHNSITTSMKEALQYLYDWHTPREWRLTLTHALPLHPNPRIRTRGSEPEACMMAMAQYIFRHRGTFEVALLTYHTLLLGNSNTTATRFHSRHTTPRSRE